MPFNVDTHLLGLERLPPERREDAVRPVVGGHVKSAEHLRRGDGFGVHAHLLVGRAALGHGLHQHLDALGLAGATGPQRHHAVTHALRLIQLDQLQDPRRVVDQPRLRYLQHSKRNQLYNI